MKLLNLNLDFRPTKRYFRNKVSLKKRLEILGKEVTVQKPGIITFQEVPDLLGLIYLKRLFGGYSLVSKGFLRVQGGVITFYDKSKWELVSKESITFSKQGKFFSKQLADRILRKGILAVVLRNFETKKQVLVINLHLTANYGQKLAEEERKILQIQLKQVKKISKRYQLKKEIISGDFNADFKSQTIQKWLKEVDFEPVFKKEEITVSPKKNPLCHRDQFKGYQIDNVLTFGFEKTKGKLIFNQKGKFLSDHYGQLVEME